MKSAMPVLPGLIFDVAAAARMLAATMNLDLKRLLKSVE
jgi:hypothetical protein